jgi:hypothetical protein
MDTTTGDTISWSVGIVALCVFLIATVITAKGCLVQEEREFTNQIQLWTDMCSGADDPGACMAVFLD